MATEPKDLTYYFVANLMNKKNLNTIHILPFFSILNFEIPITNTVELLNIGQYPIADLIIGATLALLHELVVHMYIHPSIHSSNWMKQDKSHPSTVHAHSSRPHIATFSITLLHPPLHCYILHHTATSSITMLQPPSHCYNLHHTATSSITMLQPPSHCYILHHTATSSITMLHATLTLPHPTLTLRRKGKSFQKLTRGIISIPLAPFT